jgi:hypothetical protein
MIKIPDFIRSKPAKAVAGVMLFATAASVGAIAGHAYWPPEVMAPAKPVAISSLAGLTQPLIGERIVAVSGEVAEVYGGQFVLKDASGRILVEAGRSDDAQGLVSMGQKVSVQGDLADGVLRARFLTGADGNVTALKGRHGGHGDRHGRHGERRERGDDRSMPASPAVASPAAAPAPAPHN